jgi:hypothetical protein
MLVLGVERWIAWADRDENLGERGPGGRAGLTVEHGEHDLVEPGTPGRRANRSRGRCR